MYKNRIKFFTVFLLIFTNFLFAQQRNLWSKIDEAKISNSQLQRKIKLKKYQSFELKLEAMAKELKAAPLKEMNPGKSSFKLTFPDKDGQWVTFLIKEAPVMHPDLAKAYPDNRSYVGVGEKDKSKRIRFSVNEIGLHAMIRDGRGGIQYIEPLTSDKKIYKVYDRSDLEAQPDFQCLAENMGASAQKAQALKNTDDGVLRTYRLALASTGEYSLYHIEKEGITNGTDAQKKTVVLAAMTTAMTRINALYENDLAISMQLVANNDDIIYLDPNTDPYTNLDVSLMLDENQSNLDNVIQPGNYDIGHVFGTSGDAVAYKSVVCRDGSKAGGVTGSPLPDGDNFYFDVVAHEMGHQFGASHTFNGDDGSCGMNGQRNPETAVEPGSGSTIMAYAGYCLSQNVQAHSDLYFHIISIEEIRAYVTSGSGSNCPVITNLVSNNHVPVANAGQDFTLPAGTPFKLVGEGSDADGDPITFCWEQTDNGVTIVPPSATATSGALFRSQNPTASAERFFPEFKTLITGVTSSTWEVIPEVSREMNFRLTVRDNNAEAGQVVSDDLTVSVNDAAGPFLVTSQNTEDLVWTANTSETITWNVAGTNANGINVSRVNILLSIDGGKTFTTTLAANVPNDGSQIITVPELSGPQCYVMVEAEGHYFFSMNKISFSIGEFNEICNVSVAEDTPVAIPDNDITGVSSVITIADNISVENIKVHLINETNPSKNTPGLTHTYLGDLTVTLESPEGTIVELLTNDCDDGDDIQVIFSDAGDPLSCNFSSPAISGLKKPRQELSAFNGENAQGNWTLTVVDDQPVDTGILEAWSLEICSSEPVLGVNNYVFDNFKVYPNPSDGIFKVKFSSEETGDVDILVYDLLGRKISQQTFRNEENNFDQNLDLSQVTGGIYILSVKRANKMSSHKIRIK